jgi:hypothetical protein
MERSQATRGAETADRQSKARARPETAHKDENMKWEEQIAKFLKQEPLTQP